MSFSRADTTTGAPSLASAAKRSSLLRQTSIIALFALSLAAYIGALEFTYSQFMAPRFGYLGWIYHEPDPLWMLVSYLMLLAVSAFLPFKPKRFSGYAVWFLYATLIVPVTTVPLYGGDRAPDDTFWFAVFCAVIWIGVSLATRRETSFIIPVRKGGSSLLWLALTLISIATYAYLAAVFGISFNVMSVFDIYGTRLEYRDELIPTAPLLGYLITNQGNVINPFLITYGLFKKRWPIAALGVVGQLAIYSTTGYKTVFISIPLCILLVIVLRKRASIFGSLIVVGAAALAWISIAIDRFIAAGVVDILVTRTFLSAGYLMPMYRDVYDSGKWALWDFSFLGPFVETEYTTSPGFHLGAVLLNRPDVQLNASLFADGYANLGFWGIAIEAAFLLGLLLLVDSASRGLPTAIVVPTGLLPVFALANGSPFTAVLSFGFALLIILFALYPRDDAEVPPALDSERSRAGGKRSMPRHQGRVSSSS